MFNAGDKVVFIDDYDLFGIEIVSKLKLYKTYTIGEMPKTDSKLLSQSAVYILETETIYYSHRFISLKNFRKRKLQKLNKNV